MSSSLRWTGLGPPDERPPRRTMKVVSLQLTLPVVILTIVFLTPGPATSADTAGASKGTLEAKIAYCQDCHGALGQGYHGYYPIPRIAGQQTEYFENQLRAYVEHRRRNNIMFNVARVLSPPMRAALARNFRGFNPRPLADAPRGLVGKGEQIFQNGVPEANVAACAACHGPDATGSEQIPRLAGQLYPYVVKVLANWSKERGQNPANPDTSTIMKPVAHSLTRPQIEAVAAYVNHLK
jgi:cytochrome c553